MFFRRSRPGESVRRDGNTQPINGGTRLEPPFLRFNASALCVACPPLQPIDGPDFDGIDDKGRRLYSADVPGEPRTPGDIVYSTTFGDHENTLIVSYRSNRTRVPLTNDVYVYDAITAASRCGGPVADSLGNLVCGASSEGLSCILTARNPKTVAHPELLPPPDTPGTTIIVF
jgi:hypothetical protein